MDELTGRYPERGRVRRRLGLRRVPVLTLTLFALTAAGAIAQALSPSVLETLERAPEGLHGDWWRTFTALFVQDGGLAGAIFNLAFLLAVGTCAEEVLRPSHWLACYFGAALVGELAGYAWQPHGAGNSVAVCGLAGALIVVLWSGTPPAPVATPAIVLTWCGALLATIVWPAVLVGVAGGTLASAGSRRGAPVARPAAAAATVCAAVLVAARNIHGAALVAGIAIAVALRIAGRPTATA